MVFKKLCVAAILAVASAPVLAAECSVDIAGNDQMQFDKKEITVSKSCKQFTVNLKHPGKLAKNVMGHNWVLTKTADMQGAVNDGMAAGLPPTTSKDDARVIAHTKVIGGGESDSVTFDVSKLAAGQDYTYFCSFPGHFAMMGHAQAGRLTRRVSRRPVLPAPRPEASVLPSGACPYNGRSHDPARPHTQERT